VDAGASVRSAAGSGFQFTDGSTTLLGKAKDGRNMISWADGLPEGVIGQASSYYNAAGKMTEADVRFSNAFAWSDGAAGSGTMDIQTIAMHEIGHWLVRLDQYMDGDSGKVMYGYGGEDQQKRALAAGDLAGITWIYPDQPVDTVGPVCAAKNATCGVTTPSRSTSGSTAALSAQVTMQLVISTRSGAVKRRWTWGYGENYDGWRSVNYKCKLKPGTYRIQASGKDLAGHSAGKVGKATLTVK
jgi:Matrixin